MAISLFSCLLLSIRLRGRLRWGSWGLSIKQANTQTNKQTKQTSKFQAIVMQLFFSTIGSGSNTLFLYLFSEFAILYTVAILKKVAKRHLVA